MRFSAISEQKKLIVGSGGGKGRAIDHKNQKETFMKMIELQAGLGLGIKKFRQVWAFENRKNLTVFTNSGWKFRGQKITAAKLGDEGGAFAGAM